MEKPEYQELSLVEMFAKRDQELRKAGRLFAEMVETEAWRTYEQILQAQIENMLDQLSRGVLKGTQEFLMMDAGSKLAVHEALKGLVNGVKLALSIPPTTIEEAKRLSASTPADTTKGTSP